MSTLAISKIILFWLILLCSYTTIAQTIISGKVIGTDGEPMIGANIWSKQLLTGTATDIDGRFDLTIGLSDTLIITFLGYTDVELVIADQTDVEIIMYANIEFLEEVVVTGYGTQKKKDITGATSSASAKDFNSGIINSPEQLIRGKVAGVDLTQNDGEPGSAFTVRIRGASTIRAGNDPLYVIDGYPVDINDPGMLSDGNARITKKNPLEFLNPDDIASIDILKDASAAAIYGSRGANGVIMITTKKGQIGKPQLSYSSYVGVSKLRNKLDVLSPDEYVTALSDFGLTGEDFRDRIDWQDKVYRTAFTHNHNLSFNGGTTNTRYRASVNFKNEEGIIPNSKQTKYSGRISIQQTAINKKLKLDFNLTAARVQNSRAPGGIVNGTYAQNPTWPILDEDGNYFQSIPTAEFNHPISILNQYSNVINSSRILSNLTASYEIIEGLEYKLNVGGDISDGIGKTYSFSQISNTNGNAAISTRSLSSNLIEHYLTYKKQMGALDLTGLGGYSYQQFRNEGSVLSKGDFPSDNIPLVNNIGAGVELLKDQSFKEKNALQSFFGRVHLDLHNKYLLTTNFRIDGSTRFGANNKYGFFPSLAFAWRISEESFLNGLDGLDDLKFRVSWGLTGNQEIPNKITQPVFGTPNSAQAVIGPTGQPVQGFAFTRTANPNLQWEETRQINVGIDLSLAQGRWYLGIDYFNKRTTDFLLFTQAVSAPTSSVWANLDGEIINKGWEMAFTGHLVNSGNFHWESGITATRVNNTVTGLPVPIAVGLVFGRGQSGNLAQAIMNDEPIGSFFGRRWLGFDEMGNNIFKKDEDGNDVFEILGNALPDITWGWSNNIRYNNLGLDFLLSGAHGHKIFNNGALAAISKQNFQFGSNSTAEILYTDEAIDNNLTFSSRYIESGSFIRLSYVTLSYQFPLGNNSTLRQVQIYLTGSNLWLSKKYSGYDSEVNIPISNNNEIPTIGIDWDAVPRPISFQFGISATFL